MESNAFSPSSHISKTAFRSAVGTSKPLNIFDEKERNALTRDSEPEDFFQTCVRLWDAYSLPKPIQTCMRCNFWNHFRRQLFSLSWITGLFFHSQTVIFDTQEHGQIVWRREVPHRSCRIGGNFAAFHFGTHRAIRCQILT
jgi:hypothetical protein